MSFQADVEEAIGDGVSAAEFPATLEAARASREGGMAVLMGGPNIVRGKSHSGTIPALELESNGLLEIISSDYVPCALRWGALKLHTEAGYAGRNVQRPRSPYIPGMPTDFSVFRERLAEACRKRGLNGKLCSHIRLGGRAFSIFIIAALRRST